MPASRQVGLQPHLHRLQALLLEPGDLGGSERQGCEVGERLPAPQRERLAEDVGGLRGFAVRQRLPTAPDELLEARGVKLITLHDEAVPRRRRDQDLGVAERLPQPRDVHCHRLGRSARDVLAPERDRQLVDADRLVRVQQQHSEYRGRLPTDSCDLATLAVDLERPEDPELHVAQDDATGIRATPPASKSSVRGHVEAQGRRGTLSWRLPT